MIFFILVIFQQRREIFAHFCFYKCKNFLEEFKFSMFFISKTLNMHMTKIEPFRPAFLIPYGTILQYYRGDPFKATHFFLYVAL